MLPLGHIAGIPVEETALSFGPVLLASGGVLGLRLRDRWARLQAERRSAPGNDLRRGYRSPVKVRVGKRSTEKFGG